MLHRKPASAVTCHRRAQRHVLSVRLMEGDGGTIWTSPALDFALKCYSQTTHPVFIPSDSGEQLLCEVDGPLPCRPYAYLYIFLYAHSAAMSNRNRLEQRRRRNSALSSRPPPRLVWVLSNFFDFFFLLNEIDSFVGSCRKWNHKIKAAAVGEFFFPECVSSL